MKASDLLRQRKDWVAQQPDEPLWPNGPTPAQYLEGMARPTGSYVTIERPSGCWDRLETMVDLETLFGKLPVLKDVTDELGLAIARPNHKYYTAPVPAGYRGFEAAMTLGDFANLPAIVATLADLRIVNGAHGLEVVCKALEPVPVLQLAFIADVDGLVTWYPGAFTPAIDLRQITVKLTGKPKG